MPKTTLEEYDSRFDLDGEGGDLLGCNAVDTRKWLNENREADGGLRRLLERWLWLTGFSKCPCPSCKRSRGEELLPYEVEQDSQLALLIAQLGQKTAAAT